MKAFKRWIVAAAIAAACCMLGVSVTAGAGTVSQAEDTAKCPPHHFTKEVKRHTVGKRTHEYVYAYVYNENGTIAYELLGTCTVTITYEEYQLRCEDCHELMPEVYKNITEQHSDCIQ